uniref:Vitellogenin domain-containing protein n=1 Tax=Trichogramma kaykai TaxID=54128 RepID=A0ABD2VYT6_9HYME
MRLDNDPSFSEIELLPFLQAFFLFRSCHYRSNYVYMMSSRSERKGKSNNRVERKELDPVQVIEAGLDVLTSLSNPLDLAKSTFDFASLLFELNNNENNIGSTLSVINVKLDDITRNLDSFREEVMSKLEKIELLVETKPLISSFFLLGTIIDNHYDEMLRILKENYTRLFIDDFVHGVVNYHHYHGVTQTLNRMHSTLYKVDDIVYKYSKAISSPVCPSRYLQVKIAQKFYLALHNAELKGLALLVYALKQMHRKQTPEELEKNLDVVKQNFYRRSNEAFAAQKDTMGMISRMLWNCEIVDSPEEGVTYEQFGPFIYRTFEAKETMTAPVYELCKFINDVESRCLEEPVYACNKYAYCRGKIMSCNNLAADVELYHASADKTRKYDHIEFEEQIMGIKKETCSGRVHLHRTSVARPFPYRAHASCLCTCENPDSKSYINLREVVSNVQENKVVTGIRFRKVNDILHLQVQQAKLLPSAAIDPKTKSWLKVNAYETTDRDVRVGVDYHQLSWDSRSFKLDDVEVDKNTVLTGVKFAVDQGLIRLEVRGTEFSNTSGKLRANKHSWHRHTTSQEQLSPFQLEYLDLPPEHPISQPVLTDPGRYTTLTTSSMRHDVGRSVIPFVDLKPIASRNPDVALSGVRLFHKSYKESAAGYSALKISTYDFN